MAFCPKEYHITDSHGAPEPKAHAKMAHAPLHCIGVVLVVSVFLFH